MYKYYGVLIIPKWYSKVDLSQLITRLGAYVAYHNFCFENAKVVGKMLYFEFCETEADEAMDLISLNLALSAIL